MEVLPVVLVLALAGFQTERERASSLTFSRPQGWDRKDDPATGAVTLLPPGVPAGRLCTVTIIPTQEFAGTAEVWHESIWKLLSDKATPLASPVQEKHGKFMMTRSGLSKADGNRGWISLYTALDGKRGLAIVYAADQEDLFRSHLKAVQTLIAGAALEATPAGAAPARKPGEELALEVPHGWSRQENPAQGVTYLVPPDIPAGHECAALLLPPQTFSGSEQGYHDELVRRTLQGRRVREGLETSLLGNFQRTTFVQETAPGTPQWVSVLTATWSGRAQSILFAADSQDLFQAHGSRLWPVLRKVAVPPGAPSSDPGSEYRPLPVPSKEKDVAIQGAWLATEFETRFGVRRAQSGQVSKMLLFFGNGVAAKLDARNPGGSLTYQAEGFAPLDVTDPEKLKGTGFGTWKEESGTLTVTWNFVQAPQRFRREGADLKDGDHLWGTVKPLDGVRLDGTFRRSTGAGEPWTITFRKDGTFSSSEVNNTMGGTLVNPEFPSRGSGTYEVRKWSLILRYGGGFVQGINFEIEADDPRAGKFVLLNGYTLDRVPGK